MYICLISDVCYRYLASATKCLSLCEQYIMVSLVLIVLIYITGTKAAFTVTHALAGTTSDTIRFTNVITNIGGHYNTTSGKFTCQYPGIYVFLLHIWKIAGVTDAYCWISKNGSGLISADSSVNSNTASGHDGASTSVILHLVQGDIVDLCPCSAIETFHRGWTTSFSGFLLQED